MNIELDIEVLWHTSETSRLSEAGMKYKLEDLKTETVTFYNIDVISPYYWDDNKFCKIFASADSWITPFSVDEVREMIRKAKDKENI